MNKEQGIELLEKRFMEVVILYRRVGYPFFYQKSKAAQYLNFGQKHQGNNQQMKAWGIWYKRREFQ